MQVSLINDIHQFDQLKADWERVYLADPHASFYVSWLRLRGWFEITPYDWFVLAVRPDNESSYVAFFPLNMRFLQIRGVKLIRELRMGGKPLGGYTGIVCLPEYEEAAVTALAHYIQQQMGWDSFQMEHVLDPRLDIFLKWFPQNKFEVQLVSRIASTNMPLPNTWEQYLQEYLGRESRQTLRRRIRHIERDEEFQIVYTCDDNLERQIEAALTLEDLRWGAKPGHIRNWTRDVLCYYFKHNCLWLGVLWNGQPRWQLKFL